MNIERKLEKTGARMMAAMLSAVVIALLAVIATRDLVVGMLTDARMTPPLEILQSAIPYVSNSAGVNAQLARAELASGQGRDLDAAERYARRAASLSPFDYTKQTLLASIAEAKGDRQAAEAPFRRALELAPNNADLHWRFANLLLRRGQLADAFTEFRFAVTANPGLLQMTLDLLWRASGGKLDAVVAVVPETPAARFALTGFLLGQSRPKEAAQVFATLDRMARRQSADTPKIISSLIGAGEVRAARGLWLEMMSDADAASSDGAGLLWNHSFDTEATKGYSHFDWQTGSTNYAQVAVDKSVARTGGQSLRIAFTGRDTTRLDGEFKQLVPVRPGARYRLAFFTKTEQLVTPFGPQIAVTDAKGTRLIAGSEAIAAGSSDWKPASFEFVAPADVEAVLVTIRRTPKYAYDDPTRGTIWFDDFTLVEQK